MTLSAREASIHHLNELWLKGFNARFNYSFNHIVYWGLPERESTVHRQVILRDITNRLQTFSTENLTKEECETIIRLLRQIINGDYTK